MAALGIIIGSLFSSGMMEIARSGVFMPAQFTFHDIMLIFLAVMLTDVILLDVFNTFGLPTSTTVSIVFELLGGAVASISSRGLSRARSMRQEKARVLPDPVGAMSVIARCSVSSICRCISLRLSIPRRRDMAEMILSVVICRLFVSERDIWICYIPKEQRMTGH